MILGEISVLFAAATLVIFQINGDVWLNTLSDPLMAAIFMLWLFPVLAWTVFSVVRHAEKLAHMLGEPYGTLILTLSVIGIEVALIVAIMLGGEANPTLARDTMFAVLMIVLNGLTGLALLLGGLIHREQDYNLNGARAYISVLLPLSVFALILPAFTVSTENPTYSAGQSVFMAVVTLLLYGVFLALQTGRHRGFFTTRTEEAPAIAQDPANMREITFHAVMLIINVCLALALSKWMAALINYGIAELSAPVGLGGVIIALLVLAPEGIAAMRAAVANQLQRSVNLLLGSALSTIGLTAPAVLAISLIAGHPVLLGLDPVSMILLILTLLLCAITFGGIRTNMLHGAVHVVIFLAFIMLLIIP